MLQAAASTVSTLSSPNSLPTSPASPANNLINNQQPTINNQQSSSHQSSTRLTSSPVPSILTPSIPTNQSNPWAPARPSRNHPYRIPSRGKGKSTGKYGGRPANPKEIKVRMIALDQQRRNRYRLESEDTVGEGIFTLQPHHTEEMVRNEICAMFRSELPLIEASSFEFMDCERATVFRPSVSENHEWNYNSIKSNVGTGRLYIRLLVPYLSLINKEEPIKIDDGPSSPESSDLPDELFNAFSSATTTLSSSTTTTSTTSTTQPSCDLPSTSANQPSCDLPSTSANSSTSCQFEFESLLNDLLDEKNKDCHFDTLGDAILYIRKNINLDKEKKLKIDEGDELDDVVAFYKSQSFDESANIIVQFRGQPGADAGGILRQLYYNIFKIFNSCDDWFTGNPCRRLPANNTHLLLSGVFKIVGHIFAHAIILSSGACGPKLLSPAIFWYLATGDLEATIPFISLDDATANVKHYLSMVRVFFFLLTCSAILKILFKPICSWPKFQPIILSDISIIHLLSF